MIKPLYDRILLEEVKADTTTRSGIILPESNEKPSIAKVVALGTGGFDKEGNKIEFDVSVGDKVLYKQYATTSIKYNETDYLVIDMKDILAIVEDDNNGERR